VVTAAPPIVVNAVKAWHAEVREPVVFTYEEPTTFQSWRILGVLRCSGRRYRVKVRDYWTAETFNTAETYRLTVRVGRTTTTTRLES
jgi:hypothetical protein